MINESVDLDDQSHVIEDEIGSKVRPRITVAPRHSMQQRLIPGNQLILSTKELGQGTRLASSIIDGIASWDPALIRAGEPERPMWISRYTCGRALTEPCAAVRDRDQLQRVQSNGRRDVRMYADDVVDSPLPFGHFDR